MNLDKLNNLIELFSYQAEKQNKESIFLFWFYCWHAKGSLAKGLMKK